MAAETLFGANGPIAQPSSDSLLVLERAPGDAQGARPAGAGIEAEEPADVEVQGKALVPVVVLGEARVPAQVPVSEADGGPASRTSLSLILPLAPFTEAEAPFTEARGS